MILCVGGLVLVTELCIISFRTSYCLTLLFDLNFIFTFSLRCVHRGSHRPPTACGRRAVRGIRPAEGGQMASLRRRWSKGTRCYVCPGYGRRSCRCGRCHSPSSPSHTGVSPSVSWHTCCVSRYLRPTRSIQSQAAGKESAVCCRRMVANLCSQDECRFCYSKQ